MRSRFQPIWSNLVKTVQFGRIFVVVVFDKSGVKLSRDGESDVMYQSKFSCPLFPTKLTAGKLSIVNMDVTFFCCNKLLGAQCLISTGNGLLLSPVVSRCSCTLVPFQQLQPLPRYSSFCILRIDNINRSHRS